MTRTLHELTWPRRTDRLALRPAEAADAARIWPWYGRPEVQEWTTTLPADLPALEAWWTVPDRLASTLVALRGEELVGTGMITVGDAWSQADMVEHARGTVAELGWTLDPGHQGEGLGTELAAALLQIAVEDLGLRRVTAECFADNVASRRVMEKIGMRQEAHSRQDSLHRSGQWLDGASYAVLAAEYWEQRTGGGRMAP